MRRWLLFVAIAALPGVSRADLVLYGKIYAEVAQETQGSGATRIDKTTLDDAQNTGRFGLRFSQDLENGLQAFGKYEFQLGTTNSGDNFEPRETYVGLKGRFGSFALGQFEGAYKITGGAEFDPFFGTSLEARGNGGMSSSAYGTSNFINHAVQYQSPSLDVTGDWKFTTTVQYGVDSTPGVADADRGSYLAGVDLGDSATDFIGAVAHDHARGKDNWKLGIRHRDGDVTYLIQQEKVEEGGYDPAGKGQFLLGGMHYQVGNLLYVAQVGDYKSDAPGSDASYWGFGLRYYLARNIWIVGGYRQTQSNLAAFDGKAWAAGLRYDF